MKFGAPLSLYLRPETLLHYCTNNIESSSMFITPGVQALFDEPTAPTLKYLAKLPNDLALFYTSPNLNFLSTSANYLSFESGINALSSISRDVLSATIIDAANYTKAEDLRLLLPQYTDIIEFFGGDTTLFYNPNDSLWIAYSKSDFKPIINLQKAVSNFVEGFDFNKDKISVYGFSTVVDLVLPLSNNKLKIKSKIDSMKAQGSTAFLDAVFMAANQLPENDEINISQNIIEF